MFPWPSLGEEGVKGVIRDPDRVIPRDCAIWMYPMLQAVQLPEKSKLEEKSINNSDIDICIEFPR